MGATPRRPGSSGREGKEGERRSQGLEGETGWVVADGTSDMGEGKLANLVQRLKGDVFEAVTIRTLHSFVLAVVYGMGVLQASGRKSSLNFIYAYMWECIMSLDNLNVMLAVFTYFKVPQDGVNALLRWSLLTSLVFRFSIVTLGLGAVMTMRTALFPMAGLACIPGGYLLWMSGKREENEEEVTGVQSLKVYQGASYIMSFSADYEGSRLFKSNDRKPTPLFLVLVFIALTDAVFALDSLPDTWKISKDMFSLYSSQLWGTVTVRAMYSILGHMVDRLPRMALVIGMGVVFTGFRLIVSAFLDLISSEVDFVVSVGIIVGGVLIAVDS